MIHTTPPRIAARTVAPHKGQGVKVIIDAFGNPRAATKHEEAIGKAMLKTVKRKVKEPALGVNNTRRKAIFAFCMDQWRTTAEIAEHLNTHVETVRKLTKVMHEAGSLTRKPRPGIKHVEYIYKSRDNLALANERKKEEAEQRNEKIIAFCDDWKSCREISDHIGFTMSGVRNKLRAMIQSGTMERRGKGNRIEYRRKA